MVCFLSEWSNASIDRNTSLSIWHPSLAQKAERTEYTLDTEPKLNSCVSLAVPSAPNYHRWGSCLRHSVGAIKVWLHVQFLHARTARVTIPLGQEQEQQLKSLLYDPTNPGHERLRIVHWTNRLWKKIDISRHLVICLWWILMQVYHTPECARLDGTLIIQVIRRSDGATDWSVAPTVFHFWGQGAKCLIICTTRNEELESNRHLQNCWLFQNWISGYREIAESLSTKAICSRLEVADDVICGQVVKNIKNYPNVNFKVVG